MYLLMRFDKPGDGLDEFVPTTTPVPIFISFSVDTWCWH